MHTDTPYEKMFPFCFIGQGEKEATTCRSETVLGRICFDRVIHVVAKGTFAQKLSALFLNVTVHFKM